MHANVIIFSVMAMFYNVSSAVFADKVAIDILENKPSAEHVEKIRGAFENSDVIKVSYIPRQSLGSAPLSKEAILNGWEYQFLYRCPSSCRLSAAKIQSYLLTGLKQTAQCPGPYYAALELLDHGSRVLVIYVDYTGRCFTVASESYYTPMNFDEFVTEGALYPDFVKPRNSK